MSLQLNQAVIAGNLTRDPQVRILPNNVTVCQLGVAVNRRFKNGRGELVDDAVFFDVEAWDKLADFIAGHFGKGDPIYIEGRIKLNQYEHQGGKHTRVIIVADRAQFVESKGTKAASAHAPAPAAPTAEGSA